MEIEVRELKEITNFLLSNKIVLHPQISPNGVPDFSQYKGRGFILITDRNILVRILRLVDTGTLKDPHSRRLIASLLFWCDFNAISITPGLALMEHSHFKGNNQEAIAEYHSLQSICSQYSPSQWLDLAMGRIDSVPVINILNNDRANFFIDNEHFKLNYLQTLKLCQLSLAVDFSIRDQLREFHIWSYENALIGMYSTCYAVMFFSNQTKLSNQVLKIKQAQLLRKCRNVAWDLTYLPFWSTFYWNDKTTEKVFLFVTMDKEIKRLFGLVHRKTRNPFVELIGNETGTLVANDLNAICKPRSKRQFDSEALNKLIETEEKKLLKSFVTISNQADWSAP